MIGRSKQRLKTLPVNEDSVSYDFSIEVLLDEDPDPFLADWKVFFLYFIYG